MKITVENEDFKNKRSIPHGSVASNGFPEMEEFYVHNQNGEKIIQIKKIKDTGKIEIIIDDSSIVN